jgi:hypothetical protein
MTDGHQKVFRFEPAACVDHDVIGPGRLGIDDETFHLAQVFAGWAFNFHVVEVHVLIFEVIGGQVLQPRIGMIQHCLQSARCAIGG